MPALSELVYAERQGGRRNCNQAHQHAVQHKGAVSFGRLFHAGCRLRLIIVDGTDVGNYWIGFFARGVDGVILTVIVHEEG